MPNHTKFHGILAVGRSKADAVNKYRLLALSKGATVQVDDARKIAFVTHANEADGMFNPMSGNMDLETDDAILEKLEFQSNSSATVEAHHLYCASGCGAHVVFDSEALVKFCPHCTSSLSEDDSDDESEDESEESEESDDFEADEDEMEADESESSDLDDEIEDDGNVVAVAASFEEARQLFIENSVGLSISAESLEAHHMQCSDVDCAAHVISTSAVAECPVCASSLVEAGEDEELEPEDDEDSGEEEDAESEESNEEPNEEPEDEESTDEEPAAEPAKVEEEPVPELEELNEDDGNLVISADSFDKAVDMFRSKVAGVSVSSENVDAQYVVCSSSTCGQHIVSAGVVAACPVCQSAVEEPSELEDDEEDEEDEDGESNTLSLTDTSGNVLNEDSEELDGMADVEDEAECSDLDVSYSSNVAGQARWTAFYKGMPVAMASKQDAGKNADLFDTPNFGHAALATAKVSGVRKALTELGFKGLKHKVSVSAEVRRMVDTAVAESRQSISAEQVQFKEVFMAALATAALGINRGFFTEDTNPVKLALWNALSSAGIRNPESLIDSAFKSHSDAYHKVLFARATDIASKPKEVQESLAKAIVGTQYQAVSSEAVPSNLETRLSGLGTSVSSSSAQLQEVKAEINTDRQQIQRVVQNLGRKSAR